jgi:hypothetical protein
MEGKDLGGWLNTPPFGDLFFDLFPFAIAT